MELPQHDRNFYQKITTNIALNLEKLDAFSYDQEQGKDILSHHSYTTWYWKSLLIQ